VRAKGGQRMVLDLLTITSTPQHKLVQAKLKEIGVEVNIKTGTDAWWQEAGIRGEHHILSEGVSGSDPFLLSWQFMSKNIGTGFARTRFRNARLDELLDKGEQSADQAERAKLYAEVQQIIMDNALLIPITESTVVSATRKEVKNVGLDARVFYPWMHSTYMEG
jgi:ABC-type transport system substrate-binding protein